MSGDHNMYCSANKKGKNEMNEYIEQLTARQVIEMIANEYIELSHDKIKIQRDDHIRWCNKWLELNPVRMSPLDEIRTSWDKRKEQGE
jgi:hypothetical protein